MHLKKCHKFITKTCQCPMLLQYAVQVRKITIIAEVLIDTELCLDITSGKSIKKLVAAYFTSESVNDYIIEPTTRVVCDTIDLIWVKLTFSGRPLNFSVALQVIHRCLR